MNSQEKAPLISIALCTYNGEKYLEKQLDSLINQTYPNVEIIAVDDCSNDSTLNILRTYSEKYKNIAVYSNDANLGYSKNFEKAIMLCKGEYITVSDQDDIWHLEKLAVLHKNIGDNLLIYAKSEIINSDGELTSQTSMDKQTPYSGSDPRTITLICYTWGHNMMFKKELIPLALPLPEKVSYDWFIGAAALNYGCIQYLDQTLVYHRRHNKSTTFLKYKNRKGRSDTLKYYVRGVLTLKDLKYETFFKKMHRILEKDSFIAHLRLLFFLIRYKSILFIISTKSTLSKLNYIRIIAFRGIKA